MDREEQTHRHVIGLLARNRAWKAMDEVDGGTIMELPEGGRRLLVTRYWGSGGTITDARNAAAFAAHHGHAVGGAVLAIMSPLDLLQRETIKESLAYNVELLDERDMLPMVMASGHEAMREYERIVTNGFGRRRLAA